MDGAADLLRRDLHEVAETALRASGMDSVGLYLFGSGLGPAGMTGVILGMPDPFPASYETHGVPIDPVLARMRETGAPCSTRTTLGPRWTRSQLYRRVSGRFGLTGFATLPICTGDGVSGVLYLGACTDAAAERLDAEGLCAMSPHATRASVGIMALPKRIPQLSERRNDVARLAAEGLTNAQIAARLGTGEAAVHKHMKALNRQFGTATRTAMAAAWRAACR